MNLGQGRQTWVEGQGGDEDILAVHASSSPKDTNQGPLTRSYAKKL
jgi:hypothetical protein